MAKRRKGSGLRSGVSKGAKLASGMWSEAKHPRYKKGTKVSGKTGGGRFKQVSIDGAMRSVRKRGPVDPYITKLERMLSDDASFYRKTTRSSTGSKAMDSIFGSWIRSSPKRRR